MTKRDPALEQAEQLERLQRIERLAQADKASWNAMSAAQRTAFADYLRLTSERNNNSAEGFPHRTPLSPSAWLIEQRLAPADEDDVAPWNGAAELLRNVSTTRPAVQEWLARLDSKIDAKRQELESIASDYTQRDKIKTLETEIRSEQRRLDRLTRCEPVDTYLAWRERGETAEARDRIHSKFGTAVADDGDSSEEY